MMNKTKSAKAHLVKFLFVLPVIAVLLLSFRNNLISTVSANSRRMFHLSGIVYDHKNELPLPGAMIRDLASGLQATTDNNGYYSLVVPIISNEKQELQIKVSKKEYLDHAFGIGIELNAHTGRSSIGFFSLLADKYRGEYNSPALFYAAKDQHGNALENPTYDFIKDRFENYFRKKNTDSSVFEKGIYSFEQVIIEKEGLSDNDTIPEEKSLNSKGYILDIKNENDKDIVIVKDKYQNTVKEISLDKWNKDRGRYENRYGEGVAETIDRAVKQSMKAVELQGHFQSDTIIMQLRTDMFSHKDVDSIIVTADTVEWSAKEKRFSFKGTASLQDKESHVNASGSYIMFGKSQNYVLLNGKELKLDEDFASCTKTSYLVINLGKKQAIKKYGDKGKNGAIEIFSQN